MDKVQKHNSFNIWTLSITSGIFNAHDAGVASALTFI
jgi:hypothetical protein